MKKLYFFVAAAAAMLFAACEPAEVQAPDALTLVSYEVAVGQAGVEKMPITFTANTDWTIAVDKTFVTFDPSEGAAGEDVVVNMSVAANDTYADREATVTITAGAVSSSFVVKQGFDTEFDAVVTYNLPFEASDFTFTVNTNADYKVVIPEDVDWVMEAVPMPRTKAAPASKDINFFVSENNEDSARDAVVTIDAGKIKYGIKIHQDNQAILTDPVVTYLGRRMFIFDSDASAYSQFNQYYVTFKSGEKTVAISINGAYDPENALYTFPTGVFGVDLSGKHSAQTFTVAGIDFDKYTTVIDEKGNELDIVDGTIDVKDLAGEYAITVALETAEGTKLNYKFVGELPEYVDDSFGAQLYDAQYEGEYTTYFSNKNKEWKFSYVVSRQADDADIYGRFVTIDLYADNAEPKSMNDIPAGVYNFDEPESASAGYTEAKAFSFTGSVADETSLSYEIVGGKIVVSDNEDGTKNFALEVSMRSHVLDENGYWVYDEDYNYIYNDPVEFTQSVDLVMDFEEGNKPSPDVDAVFTGCMLTNAYTGFYYGTPYSNINSIAWWIGWSLVNNVYTVNMPIISAENCGWTYEKNYANRFCNTPIPDGTYTYAPGYEPVAQSIGNWKATARKAYITNGYTGTTVFVKAGSVKFENGYVTFDLSCESTDGSVKVKYTGSFASTANYFQDYTTSASRIAQATWAVDPNA